MKVKYNEILYFVKKILKKLNCDNFTINSVAEGICSASLRGVDSHGINLLPHYVESIIHKRKNNSPDYILRKKYSSSLLLDADNAFGIAAGKKALNYAVEVAKKTGICCVGVKNSSHPGCLASIMIPLAKKNFIGIAFAQADSLMLSTNSNRAYFGTNPICFVAPRLEKNPFCVDLSTTTITWNKLLNFKNANKKLGRYLAADKNGKMTINPNIAKYLLPMGGHKGFSLASIVDVLSGVLTGMNFGKDISRMYADQIQKKRKLGQFYIIIKPDIFLKKNIFLERMQLMTNQIRKEPSIKNKKVLCPNDPEIINEKKRRKYGIPIEKNLYKKILNLSESFNLKLKIIN
jgi:LDH2 family malate/lactate/ureidoglycolate dehydrogenase